MLHSLDYVNNIYPFVTGTITRDTHTSDRFIDLDH